MTLIWEGYLGEIAPWYCHCSGRMEWLERMMREFETGATRDEAEGKPDYEGFISPLVTKRFGEYMLKHQAQADGKLRASDNWQKGIPRDQYVKSLLRHVQDLLLHHDGFEAEATESSLEDVLCAIRFNVDGYLFEILSQKYPASKWIVD
jgi:hypothetical protein